MGFEPETFGKYYLVDKIATGGMAEIFKAKTYSHGGFENLLVIKRILSHLGENEDFVEMFIDEAKVSVALQHANIVRIYDFGKILDNYFIAMECVEGKDVRALLRKLSRARRFLPIEFAAYIAHEVCKGLDYAHRKTDLQGNLIGIVHRDISPSNILLSYEGDIKIADFGIAKAESNAYNTKDGVLKGKFEYMSPEQARGEPIDQRSDVFSLGIILYEMLTGRRLFKTDSETATLEKIKAVDIEPPSALNARVPVRLEVIVMRALARDRNQRYQSAREMQDDLLEFLFPATPDVTRQSCARFMQDIFTEEIEQERQRLEEGSRVAERLRDEAPITDWDGHDSTMSKVGSRGRWVPLLLIPLLLLLVALMGLALTMGVLGWSLLPGEGPPPIEVVVPEVAPPTTGSLVVVMVPEGRILLDGEEAIEGGTLELDGMEPGTYTVRLEADGYEPHEEPITIVAGEMGRITHSLERKASTVAARSPRIHFESIPPGATVFVDGAVVGRTPFTWGDARTGGSYQIELEKSGYRRASGTVTELESGQAVTFSRSLDRIEAAPGQLSVAIIGGGWAHVWVDGTQLSQTAPLNGHSLSAGSHTVRVSNPELGIDDTQTVTVSSGQTYTLRVRPQ